MQYCRGGKNSERFSTGSDFMDQTFTRELSGVDSAGVLRQGVDILLRKANTRQQAFSFLELKIWIKTSHSTKNVETTASFTHGLKREVLSKLCK